MSKLIAVSDKLLLHRSAASRRAAAQQLPGRQGGVAGAVPLEIWITSSTCEGKLYRMSKL